MSIIKLSTNFNDLKPASSATKKNVWETFYQAMKNEKSAFFDLPVTSNWTQEWASTQTSLFSSKNKIDTFIHLGIGGSALGAETLIKALGGVTTPTFHFLDNIDPDHLTDLMKTVNPKTTLLYVVTKSGTTLETLAQFLILYKWFEATLGQEEAKQHLVFCTDPQKGDLRKLSQEWKVPTFSIPPQLGGRFSALSAVGLYPAQLAGIDCGQLLKGALDYRNHILAAIESNQPVAVLDLALALVEYQRQQKRNITVLMPYSQKLKTLTAWFTQLWAESLGKKGQGITPVGCVGATDQHSILQLLRDGPHDKVVGFIEVIGFNSVLDIKWQGPALSSFNNVSGISLNQLIDAELNATRQVLINNQRPVFTLELARLNAHSLGQILFFLETLTALAGYALDIDPFDQPGVEEGKKITQERIGACKKNGIA